MIDERNVANFLQAAGQEPGDSTARLYLGLILEEVAELAEAEGYLAISRQIQGYAGDIKRGLVPERQTNPVSAFDGGLDTLWVTIGYMLCRKFPIESGWQEVSRSNASKMVDGKLIKNEIGKVIKPETYSPPDLVPLLLAIA